MLKFRAPFQGKGWGCFVCGLSSDGAMAVICDDCLTINDQNLEFIIYGSIMDGFRVPMPPKEEEVPFDHDLTKHSELNLN
jgi:hypothetical protein